MKTNNPELDGDVAAEAQGTARISLPDAPPELASTLAGGNAVAWSQPLTIRTYAAGEPSVHPMYFDHRVYQGSSGRIYPVPFVESVADDGVDHEWQAVHLENRYVRLVVLPELGGRIHIGYDKTTGYDFFYRNNVIKPALVGIGGPWISGGIEFNWPQHHRPGTFLPVEYTIEHDDDGSVTVWCHDHDPFDRMSAQHGVCLRPDSSVVEVRVRLHNRTSERHTFLWWANVAAFVGDDYQSFFPEDVRHVADHARRAITAFPEADRVYYGVDYAERGRQNPGSNRIDNYHNIPVPTSYMIVDSQQDFFGGYDHTRGAGFVHWAERRISPGKKLWTWGNSPFGHAWDAQLTDADGPYVELMAGVYTDNQPDFSWLLPGETKTFSQYWYPISDMGPAHQASPDAAVNVQRDDVLRASFAVNAPQPGATLRLLRDGEVVAERTVDMVPGTTETIGQDGGGVGEPTAELVAADGRLLVRWTPTVVDNDEEPWVAEEPPGVEDIETVEELYLTGRHLHQYRHPTRSPLSYWREALRRDPGDVRTNLALADHEYRTGSYEVALTHARAAIERLTRRNTNPTDTEAYYLAGLALRRLGHNEEAAQFLGKAGWDARWAGAAGFELAQLLAQQGNNRAALRVLDSLDGVVGHDVRRTALRVIIARRVGQQAAADSLLRSGLALDPMDATLRVLADERTPRDAGILLDVALDLFKAGACEDALRIVDLAVQAPLTVQGNFRPVAHYVAAQILTALGDDDEAAARRKTAQGQELAHAFPHGLDAHDALVQAVAADRSDPVAKFLLGMLHYQTQRRHDAMALWDDAIELGFHHPVLLRNAGLASYNVARDDAKAWHRYEQAVAADPSDARIRYEQDQLAIRLGQTTGERLTRLSGVEDIILTRDDFTIEYVMLLAAEGRAERGLEILTTRQFHPWEGGEGKAVAAWDATHEALGLPRTEPPANLGETRPQFVAPPPIREDGVTDYFATSLPELLLFTRD